MDSFEVRSDIFSIVFGCLCVQLCRHDFWHAGADSPGAVRKLMALSDKVRPHNPKIPVAGAVSPVIVRRGPSPISPRNGPSRPIPVTLMPESSCLGQGHRKQPVIIGKT